MLTRVQKIFRTLEESGIKLNLSKCTFGEAEVKFLGHLVSIEGCKPDPKNVEAIKQMQSPSTVKGARRYLRMCSFYRKHIQNFAKLAAPLNNLTKKNTKFNWTEECQHSFTTLKQILSDAPVLVKADLTQLFIVTTDASNTHVGGVLSQIQTDVSNKPIGYFSKKLNPTESRYSATDREALGVVLTCRNFHHYLWGTKFSIFTDHQPLTSIFKRKTKSPRMSRWIVEMREYTYDIKYLKGKHNVVADSLSRPIRVIRLVVEPRNYLGLNLAAIAEAQREDERWKRLAEYLEGGNLPTKLYPKVILDQFVVEEKVLYFIKEKVDGTLHYCLVVPQSLKQKALEFAHIASGHFEQKKTNAKAEEFFYWANLKFEANHCQKLHHLPTV